MTLSESRVSKTFIIRSPFVVVNKTGRSYMLRIEKPEKTQALAPGESYALSPEELGGKIRFATIDDFEAETDTEKTGNFGDF